MQILETTFNSLQPQQREDKLLIEIKIATTETGRYKLTMVSNAYDGLTHYVFVKNNGTGEYFVREITQNNVYEDEDSLNQKYLKSTYEFVYYSETYEDIISKMNEVLQKVSEYRKKVREKVLRKNFVALI